MGSTVWLQDAMQRRTTTGPTYQVEAGPIMPILSSGRFSLPGGFGQACYVSNIPSYIPDAPIAGGHQRELHWRRHLLFLEMRPQSANILIRHSGSSLNVDNPVPATLLCALLL
jgi:hypothetical protein